MLRTCDPRFPQSQSHSFTFRANSRMSGAVSKRVSRVTRRMTSMITMQHKPPDLYKAARRVRVIDRPGGFGEGFVVARQQV